MEIKTNRINENETDFTVTFDVPEVLEKDFENVLKKFSLPCVENKDSYGRVALNTELTKVLQE